MQGRVIREMLEGIQQYGFYVNHLERGVYLWSIDDAGAGNWWWNSLFNLPEGYVFKSKTIQFE
jgi:hypothetical protein